MSSIPEAREKLMEIAVHLWSGGDKASAANAIQDVVVDLLYRRPQARPSAGVRSKRITATLRDDIKRAIDLHPDAHLSEIATQFGVNPGRVSEIAHGDKDHL